jgi:hypothetical protein
MWIHGALLDGPATLYPPTAEQFESLIDFLMSDHREDKVSSPLPIYGTPQNRPRWNPSHPLTNHIFRDRFERNFPTETPRPSDKPSNRDWPELLDEWFLQSQSHVAHDGGVVDEEAIKAAHERLQEVTPTSPSWCRFNKENSSREYEPLI